jgi:hypothetical protein
MKPRSLHKTVWVWIRKFLDNIFFSVIAEFTCYSLQSTPSCIATQCPLWIQGLESQRILWQLCTIWNNVQCFIKSAIFWGSGNCGGHNTGASQGVIPQILLCVSLAAEFFTNYSNATLWPVEKHYRHNLYIIRGNR